MYSLTLFADAHVPLEYHRFVHFTGNSFFKKLNIGLDNQQNKHSNYKTNINIPIYNVAFPHTFLFQQFVTRKCIFEDLICNNSLQKIMEQATLRVLLKCDYLTKMSILLSSPDLLLHTFPVVAAACLMFFLNKLYYNLKIVKQCQQVSCSCYFVVQPI